MEVRRPISEARVAAVRATGIRLVVSLALAVLLLPAARQAAAEAAVSAAGVPVYPGSRPAEDPWVWGGVPGRIAHERLQDRIDGMPLKSKSEETYTAPAPKNEVAAYFFKTLGGAKSSWEAVDKLEPARLAPGTSTPVQHYVISGGNGPAYYCAWYRRDANGDITMFRITIARAAKEPSWSQGVSSTLYLERKNYSGSIEVAAPSEASLGAPLYPGAVFDSPKSTIAPAPLGATYTFRTNDPAQKVAAFYVEALGEQALMGEPMQGGENWYFTGYSSESRGDTILVRDETQLGMERGFRTTIEFHRPNHE